MAYERWVGLQVTDAAQYQNYRRAMTPLLATYGGSFRYDFWIQETLKSASDKPINRVFAIAFSDRASSDAFFADPDYLSVRKEYFDSSVAAITMLAEFERP